MIRQIAMAAFLCAIAVPGVARELAEVDAELAHRFRVLAPDVHPEDQLGVGIAIEPAVVLDLGFQLPRRPARITERENGALRTLAARDRLQDVERRREANAVVARTASSSHEEVRRAARSRARFYRPPLSTWTGRPSAAADQVDPG